MFTGPPELKAIKGARLCGCSRFMCNCICMIRQLCACAGCATWDSVLIMLTVCFWLRVPEFLSFTIFVMKEWQKSPLALTKRCAACLIWLGCPLVVLPGCIKSQWDDLMASTLQLFNQIRIHACDFIAQQSDDVQRASDQV